MKIFSFIVTLALQFVSVFTLKLLDNFHLILGIVLACLVTGLAIRSSGSKTATTAKKIAWGPIVWLSDLTWIVSRFYVMAFI